MLVTLIIYFGDILVPPLNDTNPNFHACANTQDNVYLLSYKDYLSESKGFSTELDASETRTCRTTDWARVKGASVDSNGTFYGQYWTRSPSSIAINSVWIVYYEGSIYTSGGVDSSNICVRPAITINI